MADPRVMDPEQELVDRSSLSEDEVAEVVAVLDAMRAWSDAERRLSAASQRYMRLGASDMRALRFVLASQRHGIVATPRTIAAHLEISPAAVTKMLDRLEAGRHIERSPHPVDRRSTAIRVTDATRASARASVGRSHARRFDAVAGLGPEDRAAALRFLHALVASADEPPGPGTGEDADRPDVPESPAPR